jgi:GT2 family glycosyltransferase
LSSSNPTFAGIVIIGRNEGARLVRCLDSLRGQSRDCVYVDSGSSDGSVSEARSRDARVVELDMSVPFTAARARNAGFRKLSESKIRTDYVHFFDGDSEVMPGWVDIARQLLDEHAEVGIVFGRQRERFPERSIYNTLLDIEWDTPIGIVKSSGGSFMCRCELFKKLGGFREDMIAGEDPEFCVRARAAGALVWHLDQPMALHDGEMLHFSQWWKRAKRTGYAFLEGMRMHGAPPELHYRREVSSVCIWSLVLPTLIIVATVTLSPMFLWALLLYPLQVTRIALHGKRDMRTNWLYALFVMLGKLPELVGCLSYLRNRARGRHRALIEYK